MWEIPQAVSTAGPSERIQLVPRQQRGQGQGRGQGQARGQGSQPKGQGKGARLFGKPGKGQAKRMEGKFRDGKVLCMDYNKGRCQARGTCPKGLHACAGVTLTGRLCGMNHPASACTNIKVPKR